MGRRSEEGDECGRSVQESAERARGRDALASPRRRGRNGGGAARGWQALV